jgi:hypothetical protein
MGDDEILREFKSLPEVVPRFLSLIYASKLFVCCEVEGMIPVGYGNFERNVNFQLLLNSGWAILLSKFPAMVAIYVGTIAEL